MEPESPQSPLGDLALVIGLLVVLFILWVSQGAQLSDGDSSIFARHVFTRGGEITSAPGGTKGGGQAIAPDTRALEREIAKVTEDLKEVGAELEAARLRGDISPYTGKIIIEKRSTGPRATDPAKEYVTISANRDNADRIPIAGWVLESLITKERITIEGASLLPRTGVVNDEPSLFLPPGNTVIITTGRSPIGTSFRTNICTGYFEQFQNFTPALRRECPLPEDELINELPFRPTEDTCFDFVDRISRCTFPVSALPATLSPSCNQFITERLNYTGCIAVHRNDADFFKSEWRVYLKRDKGLWRSQREVIRLLDREGKMVDVFTY